MYLRLKVDYASYMHLEFTQVIYDLPHIRYWPQRQGQQFSQFDHLGIMKYGQYGKTQSLKIHVEMCVRE